MKRRILLAKILSLLVIPLAPWAQADEEGKGREKEEKKKKSDKEEERWEDRPAPRYYGQVEGVEEDTLWVGGRALRVQTPLLPYLAPGMVVEVGPEGLAVLSPATWAYYQGPGNLVGLGQGPVRAWWGEGGVLWRVLPGNGGQALLVARYRKGGWQAVPKGFALPHPPQEGWWLLALEGKTGRLMRRLE